jgi:glucokinase
MTTPLAIGIDVGATKIAAALVTRQGEVLVEERVVTAAKDGGAAVVERIAATVSNLAARAPGPVAGVGIGAPGFVDSVQGVVYNAVNLGWVEMALAAEVRRLAGETAPGDRLDIWVDNDANVQALGEYFYGAARGVENSVCITIGTGLGCGIVVDGRLVAGATFTAAELGHFSLDPDGRRCACGLRGCVETVVSGPGLVATARELLAAGGIPTGLDAGPALTSRGIEAAARAGDALALAALAEVGRWLGIAFAAIAMILNPEVIVVGGGLGLSTFDLLVPSALAELARRAVAQSYSQLRIVPSQVTSSAVGASSLVWQARG